MTDDLVVRLRSLFSPVTDSACNAMRIEAADEIERLRERLARAEASLREIPLNSNGATMHIARAYLFESQHADAKKG